MKTKMMMPAMLVIAMLGSGCATDQLQRNKGAIIGGAIGTGLGSVAAHNIDGLHDDQIPVMVITGAVGTLGGMFYDWSHANFAQQNAQMQANATAANTVIVQVPTSTGGLVQVPMVRDAVGFYHGPRGEVYQFLPTAEQLKPVYGF